MESDLVPRILIKQLTNCRIDGFQLYDEIPLGNENVVIGRSVVGAPDPKPNVRILGDESISRRHAEISFDPETNRYSICDLGSTWGTYLNERRLECNVLWPLEDGDAIQLVRQSGEPIVAFIFRMYVTTAPPNYPWKKGRQPADQPFNFDKLSGVLYVNGVAHELSGNELKVLTFLYQNKGIVCHNAAIALEVWGVKLDPWKPDANKSTKDSIRHCILTLRKKTDVGQAKPRYIVSAYDGYRLDA